MSIIDYESNYPARRMAFWREYAYDFDQLTRDLKTHLGDRPLTEEDNAIINSLLPLLRQCRNLTMTRYATTINEYVEHEQKLQEDLSL